MTDKAARSHADEDEHRPDNLPAHLTVAKAVEQGKYLEESEKYKPAASGTIAMAAGAAGEAAAPPGTEFSVLLMGLVNPAKKINVIKVVREITGLGLKEAKDLVEAAPKPVKENASEREVLVIKRKLEEAGARVSVPGLEGAANRSDTRIELPPDVIRQQIDEARSSLTEKLETLQSPEAAEVAEEVFEEFLTTGDKIVGTVKEPLSSSGGSHAGIPSLCKGVLAWFGDEADYPRQPLLVGRQYFLHFQIGTPVGSTPIEESGANLPLANFPPEGLDVYCVVVSSAARLTPADEKTSLTESRAGNSYSSACRFVLHVPPEENSPVCRIGVTPLYPGSARLDILLFVNGEVYRQCAIALSVAAH